MARGHAAEAASQLLRQHIYMGYESLERPAAAAVFNNHVRNPGGLPAALMHADVLTPGVNTVC
jgi:hypothetical protein